MRRIKGNRPEGWWQDKKQTFTTGGGKREKSRQKQKKRKKKGRAKREGNRGTGGERDHLRSHCGRRGVPE